MPKMNVIARIEPGELYQRGRKNGLGYDAANRMNRLKFVELEVDFDQDGQIRVVNLKKAEAGDPPKGSHQGWPFCQGEMKGEYAIS